MSRQSTFSTALRRATVVSKEPLIDHLRWQNAETTVLKSSVWWTVRCRMAS